MHVFFECVYARQVWESLGMTQWIQVEPGGTAFSIFKRLFSTGTKDQCLLLVLTCYSLWNRRNQWVWNKVVKSVFGTKQTVLNLLADWRLARMENIKNKPGCSLTSRRWQRPQTGWVKVNIDAANFNTIPAIGIGGVIRDENGVFLRGMAKIEWFLATE